MKFNHLNLILMILDMSTRYASGLRFVLNSSYTKEAKPRGSNFNRIVYLTSLPLSKEEEEDDDDEIIGCGIRCVCLCD